MSTRFICKPFSELSLEELYDSLALRQEVFIIEQTCLYQDADGKDQKCWHLMGYQGEQLVSYSRLLPMGVSYPQHSSIGRIVTSPKVRGQGAGRELTAQSIAWIKRLFPEVPVMISAQCYLIQFYNSFGFATRGESYLEDDIPHILMELEEQD